MKKLLTIIFLTPLLLLFIGLLVNRTFFTQAVSDNRTLEQFESDAVFKRFYSKISSIVTIPYKDAKTIWSWGSKKIRGQKIQEEEKREAKKAIIRAGLTVGAVLLLVFTTYYTYRYIFSERQLIPMPGEVTVEGKGGIIALEVTDQGIKDLQEELFKNVSLKLESIKKDFKKLLQDKINGLREMLSVVDSLKLDKLNLEKVQLKGAKKAIRDELTSILMKKIERGKISQPINLFVQKIKEDDLKNKSELIKKVREGGSEILQTFIDKERETIQRIEKMRLGRVDRNIHITICDCDKDSGCNIKKVQEIISTFSDIGSFNITGISLMSPKRPWIVLAVKSDDLQVMYANLTGDAECRCTSGYHEYKPHISVSKIMLDLLPNEYLIPLSKYIDVAVGQMEPDPSKSYTFKKKDIKYFGEERIEPLFAFNMPSTFHQFERYLQNFEGLAIC